MRSLRAEVQNVHIGGFKEKKLEKQSEDRTVLVVLRQGTATPHGPEATPAKEIVQGVASWTINQSEQLELHSAAKELVATFRDWSFVKFVESKN